MGYPVQQYTSIMPDDLLSPTDTLGGYQDEFIEGWTSAQGRISTLSSPTRMVRGSMGSPRGPLPVGSDSSSPPLPRETILDRAFQLRCIPGSEREVPGEEKLSSLARFDALMREAEERRKAKERDQAAVKEPLRSTWEEDDSESANCDGVSKESDDEDSDADGFDYDLDDDGNTPVNSGHRALEYIASHRSSVQSPPFRHMSRNSVSYQESHSMTSGASIARPHTAHSKLRPVMAPRTISQPQPIPLSLDRLASTPMPLTEEGSVQRHGKRDSTSSIKRLSFNEFTKRLSSTSSLLLVQTNQSTSSRGSSEVDGLANSRGTTFSPEREDRCGWRGSVGVFGGNDGGFI
ncbi:hypothetical protein DL766_005653 [Monosporascus sp. MC13-8B]|uniref:Uncharacterized protein n=1 Tax=Monosporascus cannonballus TaxID=155416 RepID=A0ABY0H4K1_9PEZI|nr:hypothetical protein DL762_005547 [Monosporascus cannonballus]RYO89528.1 hypothetical protein DL763_005628 [Monosporascus cannonballus]RYP28875.1 hypothetical protein DL766_005653 [Monosporascus sp. MC13-8B]